MIGEGAVAIDPVRFDVSSERTEFPEGCDGQSSHLDDSEKLSTRQLTSCDLRLFAKQAEPRLTARLGPSQVRGNDSPCHPAFLQSDELGILLWGEALWNREISVSKFEASGSVVVINHTFVVWRCDVSLSRVHHRLGGIRCGQILRWLDHLRGRRAGYASEARGSARRIIGTQEECSGRRGIKSGDRGQRSRNGNFGCAPFRRRQIRTQALSLRNGNREQSGALTAV